MIFQPLVKCIVVNTGEIALFLYPRLEFFNSCGLRSIAVLNQPSLQSRLIELTNVAVVIQQLLDCLICDRCRCRTTTSGIAIIGQPILQVVVIDDVVVVVQQFLQVCVSDRTTREDIGDLLLMVRNPLLNPSVRNEIANHSLSCLITQEVVRIVSLPFCIPCEQVSQVWTVAFTFVNLSLKCFQLLLEVIAKVGHRSVNRSVPLSQFSVVVAIVVLTGHESARSNHNSGH